MRHIILPVALSVLIGLTGQSLAASRGIDRAVGQMVLCTGTGPVVVYVDDQGQPTRPPHYCPDYALALLGALGNTPQALPVAPAQSRPVPVADAGSLISAPIPLKPARAPPVVSVIFD